MQRPSVLHQRKRDNMHVHLTAERVEVLKRLVNHSTFGSFCLFQCGRSPLAAPVGTFDESKTKRVKRYWRLHPATFRGPFQSQWPHKKAIGTYLLRKHGPNFTYNITFEYDCTQRKSSCERVQLLIPTLAEYAIQEGPCLG